ncbi:MULTISPECIES: hypothetical protein [Cupriavidus]
MIVNYQHRCHCAVSVQKKFALSTAEARGMRDPDPAILRQSARGKHGKALLSLRKGRYIG